MFKSPSLWRGMGKKEEGMRKLTFHSHQKISAGRSDQRIGIERNWPPKQETSATKLSIRDYPSKGRSTRGES